MKRCIVCTSEHRELIESAVRAGEPYRVVALKYRVSYSALQRHVVGHMSADETVQRAAKLRLEDVMNIPDDMAERKQLLGILLTRSLEPLTRPGGTLDDVPLTFVIKLLKIQQADEITVLRVNGFVQSSNEPKVSNVSDDEVYAAIMKYVDNAFDGNPEAPANRAHVLPKNGNSNDPI